MDVSPATSSEPFRTTIAPWLAVSDAQKAVDFYTAAFGAVEIYRLEGDDGKLEIAQLEVGDAAFWVQEDSDADLGALESTSFRMILSVKDPNSAYDRAVAAGATEVAPVSEEYGWRTGRITDPFGYDWELSRELAE
jgi:PhnB protein